MVKNTRRNLRTELSALLWGRAGKKRSIDQILIQVGQLKTFQMRALGGESRKHLPRKPMTSQEQELLARWVLDNIS
jgi:hypothetical protein